RLGVDSLIPRLIEEALERHPHGIPVTGSRALSLLEAVVEAQAELIARWMVVGFVHGVMNTDNTTISGQSIDYGPCAFIDSYNPEAVFSSIDTGGRYAYSRQPAIAQWNLTRLAETLLPQIDPDPGEAITLATTALQTFESRYRSHYFRLLSAKLGIHAAPDDLVETLSEDLLAIMAARSADFTATFRALAQFLRDDEAPAAALIGSDPITAAWLRRWRNAVTLGGLSDADVATAMDAVNPLYIPRNHLVDEALVAAVDGDMTPFRTLLEVVTSPYVEREGAQRYAEPGSAAFAAGFRTFCGT
ncbi:MAG: protein adenylyltransferase SelO family protein, partial [Ornithinimicrobium sp.]